MVKLPAFGPTHRIGLGVIREWFRDNPEVTVGSLIRPDTSPSLPFIMVRGDRRSGRERLASADERHKKTTLLSIETFAVGINAESDAYEMQESCRLALYDAWWRQVVIPDGGSIAVISGSSDPAAVSDWATSTGVVQYASLPKDAVRYESIYQVMIRPPDQETVSNRFIPQHYLDS